MVSYFELLNMASLLKTGKGKPSTHGDNGTPSAVEAFCAFLGCVPVVLVLMIRDEKLTLLNAILLAAPIEDEKTVLGNVVNLLDGCGQMRSLMKQGWSPVLAY